MAFRRSGHTKQVWSEQLEVRNLLSTITVTSLDDDEVADGEVTLREAVRAANTDTSVDGSNTGSGADRIVFAEGLAGGAIQLQSGAFEITQSLVIRGPNQRITIDAGAASGIFRVTADVELAVLNKLRLVNAIDTAVVTDAEALRVAGSQFVNNAGMDGGAISSRRGAHTEVSGSLFDRNTGAQGGAIHAANGVDVSSSKFRRNTASNTGGAIHARASSTRSMTITGSKFHRNAAGQHGGAIHFDANASMLLKDSVLTGNVAESGAAIYGNDASYGATTIRGTSIEQNVARSRGGAAVQFYGFYCGFDFDMSNSRVLDSVITGNRGNGIRMSGCYSSLNVSGSVITGNEGNGVMGEERVTVSASEISGNIGHGAVADYLYVRGSTISGNTGAGLSSSYPTIDTSAVLKNQGGGIDIGIEGSVTNVTVAENHEFGIHAAGELISLTHLTVVDNVLAPGMAAITSDFATSTSLSNSIVANNVTTDGQRIDLSATITPTSSLISSNLGTDLLEAPPGSPDENGNLVGTNFNPLDPLLGITFDNGEATPTAALSHNSPAVNAGIARQVATDQNGRARGDSPDMGAFEFVADLHRDPTVVVRATSAHEAEEELRFEVRTTSLPSPGETVSATMDVRRITARTGLDLPEFTPVSLTWAADGPTGRTVAVPLVEDDHLSEPDRTLELFASELSGEHNGQSPGVGSIINDDDFVVRASATPTPEGHSGTTPLRIDFEIVSGQLEPFSVGARTADGTAKLADGDFQEVDRSLSFAGVVGETQSLEIPIVGDTRPELSEYLLVDVGWPFNTAVRAEIVNDDTGVVLLRDDMVIVSADLDDVIQVTGSANAVMTEVNGVRHTFAPVAFGDIVIESGRGNDSVTIAGLEENRAVSVVSGEGNDRIQITGTSRNVVSAGAGSDTVSGGEGGDTLNGQDGDDIVSGNGGNDVLSGGNGSDQLTGGAGNDRARGDADPDTIRGGDGHDTLQGNQGRDSLSGGRGNDRLLGGGQQDVLRGDDGRDRLFGGSGNDVINAGNGADSVLAGSGADLVYGGSGNDTLHGEKGIDRIFGEGGHDRLSGEQSFDSGENYVDGGDDHDRLERSTFGRGGEGDDTLVGTNEADRLYGDGGADVIFGIGGNDTIRGGTGNDVLSGGHGNDLIHGEGANDTLFGSEGDDTLYGNSGRDHLQGENGDDVLFGGRHGDGLFGGDGADMQNGGGGDDLLHGGLSPTNQSGDIWRIWRSTDSYLTRVAAVIDALSFGDSQIERTDQDADTLIDTAGRNFYMALTSVDIFALDDNERLFELMP